MKIDRLPYRSSGVHRALVVFLAVTAFGGCGDGKSTAGPEKIEAAPLAVLRAEGFTVQPVAWPKVVRTQGSLFADEVAVIGAKVTGRVSKAMVDLGDTVAENDVLVQLDQSDFRIHVAQAEAQLQQARSAVGLLPEDPVESLNPVNAPPVREALAIWDEAKAKEQRARQLRSQNVITVQEMEEVAAAQKVAASRYASAINSVREKIALIGVRTAELDLARQRLAESEIKASFDGVVEERHVAPGSFVQIGQPIVTLLRTNPLHFRGKIPERFARKLTLGQEVRLSIESVSRPYIVQVTRIDPALDRLSRSLLFEAELRNDEGRLKAGLFAEAQVVVDATAINVVVPATAVTEFAGVEKVWKIIDGVSREHVVLTGERRDGFVEVVEGLAAGDVLLTHANQGRVARIELIDSGSTATLISAAPPQAPQTVTRVSNQEPASAP